MNLKDLPSEERAKIAAVISKDRKDDIGWMYKQNNNNEDSEAFLLGKRVPDVGQLQQMTQDYEESPAQRLTRIDMQLKYREDPLTLMKQREAEKRMELLQNTAKVKKLKRLLTLQKHQRTKKRKEKYKRRSRRSRSRSSDSDSRSSSSGDELLEKFIKIVRRSDQKEETGTSEPKIDPHSNTNSGSQISSARERSKAGQPSDSCVKMNESLKKPELSARLSKEELEAKRAQMARDAEDYAKQRLNRYTSHTDKKKEEEARQSSEASRHGASFLSRLKNDHVQRASIEEGIHRKAGSRQRGEMNSNFLRR